MLNRYCLRFGWKTAFLEKKAFPWDNKIAHFLDVNFFFIPVFRSIGSYYTFLLFSSLRLAKEDKHLLDRYSEKLHSYIRSSITDGRGFAPEDSIRQWKEDQHPPQDENLESVPPLKKSTV